MKKITFIYLLAACAGSLVISGYLAGAGSTGFDFSGAETSLSNSAGCGGFGCHSSAADANIGVSIEFDSAGVPVTHYIGGMSYSVIISGINNGTDLLPKFGFQMASIKGIVSAASPVSAGTWIAPYAQGTHYTPPGTFFTAGLVEQSSAILATTGTGGTGSTYVKTFNWTAPAAGTGVISMWAALNAVNGNGAKDAGDKWNTTHLIINEWGGTAGIDNTSNSISNFKLALFPNPASDNIHLTYSLNKRSAVSVKMFDLTGRLAAELLNEIQNEGEHHLNTGVSSFSKGVYFVILNADGVKTGERIVIQ